LVHQGRKLSLVFLPTRWTGFDFWLVFCNLDLYCWQIKNLAMFMALNFYAL